MAKYIFSLSASTSKRWLEDLKCCTRYVNGILAFFYYRSAKVKGIYRFRSKDDLIYIQFLVRTGAVLSLDLIKEEWHDILLSEGSIDFAEINKKSPLEFTDDLEVQLPFLSGEPVEQIDRFWEDNNKSFKLEFKAKEEKRKRWPHRLLRLAQGNRR